ncbi:MAG: purine-nucleoside phosphorylase [Myxococcota bacterium]|jgi:purine-nucleoside phosphorylase
MSEIQLIRAAVAKLQHHFGDAPAAAIVLGSGGAPMLDRWRSLADGVAYEALALPRTTVTGHSGQLGIVEITGQPVAVLSGRVHGYEGRGAAEQLRAVRALAAWGVKRVILTSAVGGLRLSLPPGSLVRISDHINLSTNPLMGENIPDVGPRFPDLTGAYDPALGAIFDEAAAECGVTTHVGVYASVSGPSYETPAEVRMLGMLGGDVVGMSLGPEVTGAAHAGLKVVAISVVSNLAAGLATQTLTHTEVLEVVGEAVSSLARVIEALLKKW